jgi:hypothetical protein
MDPRNLLQLLQNPLVMYALLIWELVWKGLALWQAAKKEQKYWFMAILIFNTVGILPISYLLLERRTKLKKIG